MKHLCILAVAAALTGSGITAFADPISLADLIDEDQSITIGDKVFSDFQWLGSEGPGALTIDATMDGPTHLLTIAGSSSSSLFHGTLAYNVSTLTGAATIVGIDQTLVPGDNGLALGAETASAGGEAVGQSMVISIPLAQVADLEDPEAEAGDDLEFAAQSSVDVTTTVVVSTLDGTPVTDFSLVQSFHQRDGGETPGVPDGGMTLLLLGGALSGLAVMRRKAAKAGK